MAAFHFGHGCGGSAQTSGDSGFRGLVGAPNNDGCCCGGRAIEVPSNDGDRLTGAAPQPRQKEKFPRFLCGECGSADIQSTAWTVVNTGEVVNDDGPTDQIWCPDCEQECSTLEDSGSGFELWREGEFCEHFATFADALAEAKQSDRPYEISEAHTPVEVIR